MLELILLVLVFLSSRLADYAVLAIISVYGIWGIYMKTYQPEVWLKIQDAEDRRRAAFCSAIVSGTQAIVRRVVAWITPMNQ